MARERDSANNGRDVSQDALARMAIRNTQMKVLDTTVTYPRLEACLRLYRPCPFCERVVCFRYTPAAEDYKGTSADAPVNSREMCPQRRTILLSI